MLISDNASAPPASAARAERAMFGDVRGELDDHRDFAARLNPARNLLAVFGDLANRRAHAALAHAVRAAIVELDSVCAGVFDFADDIVPCLGA